MMEPGDAGYDPESLNAIDVVYRHGISSIFEPEPIRDEIVKVFRSIRPYTVLDMDKMVVRGQYIGYREEKNVVPRLEYRDVCGDEVLYR